MEVASGLSQLAMGHFQQRVNRNAGHALAVARALKRRLEKDTSFLGDAPQPTSSAFGFSMKKGKRNPLKSAERSS